MDPPPRLVNFCLQPLLSAVHCSCVCADGFPVTNLTSRDAQIRAKGFRVERFIRPPVHIELHFCVPINLSSILVHPDLEEDGEARVEVYGIPYTGRAVTSDEFRHCGNMILKATNGPLQILKAVGGIRDEVSALGSSASSSAGAEHPLKPWKGLHKLCAVRVSIVRFTGVRPVALKLLEVWASVSPYCDRESKQFVQGIMKSLQTQSPLASPLPCVSMFSSAEALPPQALHKGPNSLIAGNESPLQLPAGGCCRDNGVPFLSGSVSISKQGIPRSTNAGERGVQKDCCRVQEKAHLSGLVVGKAPNLIPQVGNLSGKLKKPLGQTWVEAGETIVVDSSVFEGHEAHPILGCPSRDQCHEALSDCKPPQGTSHAIELPNKYLDEITYELMQIPMLLPSGHFVDRSTLDKLQHSDLTYGRRPTDPFTGVAFSGSSRPQFCPELKAQIDRFTSAQGGPSGQGRALGSASAIAHHLQLVRGQSAGGVKRRADCGSSPPLKRHSGIANTGSGKDRELSTTDVYLKEPAKPSGTTSHSDSSIAPAHQSHEGKVAQSLDNALKDLFPLKQ